MKTDRALEPILVMAEHLPLPALTEVERALALKLNPKRKPAEQRLHELGFLAELLEERFPGELAPAILRVPKTDYDRRRPATAPPGATLSRRYGGWMGACQAANGLRNAANSAWVTGTISRDKPLPYSAAEVIEALRACAEALGVDVGQLTANRYYAWVAARRRDARERGLPAPRLPTQRSVDRLFDSFVKARGACPTT